MQTAPQTTPETTIQHPDGLLLTVKQTEQGFEIRTSGPARATVSEGGDASKVIEVRQLTLVAAGR